ncbi:MAG: hypothetical protein P8077_02120, partial [Gammaproteobacteria bacterium]
PNITCTNNRYLHGILLPLFLSILMVCLFTRNAVRKKTKAIIGAGFHGLNLRLTFAACSD